MSTHTELEEQKKLAKSIEPALRIGKNGITDGQVKEVEILLKKRKLVKIKVLKTMAAGTDMENMASRLAHKTHSEVVDVIGHVMVLYKK
jgi:RNA-binding protein